MTVRKLLVLSAVVATAFVGRPALAGPIALVSSGVGGAPIYANRLNFDDLVVAPATSSNVGGTTSGPGGTAVVAFTGDAKAVTGASSGQYAAPVLSGSNGQGFGALGGDQGNGTDSTPYLTTGTGSVTITFATEQRFFGLLWGSVDDYNTLTFYNGALELNSFTGLQVLATANGSQTADGTVYANFNALDGELGFTRVVARSTQNAFEFDNVSYKETPLSVPDGGTTLALLGLGLTGMGLLRRRLQ